MAKDDMPRLRASPLAHPPSIVLVNPEIPQNTGNIARLAGALACPLHLVGELGFRIDDKAVRRAGLDYWHLVDVRTHADLDAFATNHPPPTWKLSTRKAPTVLTLPTTMRALACNRIARSTRPPLSTSS